MDYEILQRRTLPHKEILQALLGVERPRTEQR